MHEMMKTWWKLDETWWKLNENLLCVNNWKYAPVWTDINTAVVEAKFEGKAITMNMFL